ADQRAPPRLGRDRITARNVLASARKGLVQLGLVHGGSTMQMRSLSFAALALALAMGGVAHAKSGSKPDKNAPPVQLNVEESAAQQMERIERALGTEQYNEIGPDDRLKVQAALNRIRARLAGQETVAQVNPQARTD